MKSDQRHIAEERSKLKYREQLAAEAAEWVARAPCLSRGERGEFINWLATSPDHVREFLLAARWDDILKGDLTETRIDIDQLLSSNNVIDVTPRIQAQTPTPTRASTLLSSRLRVGALGMLAAIFIAALVPFAGSNWSGDRYSTSIGEQRTIALSDGSLVVLNTRTRVRVDYTTGVRNFYLTAGQAMFSVAHDASRPFRVHVDGGVIQAIGTKFDVRREANETSVAVVEGRVRVTPAIVHDVFSTSVDDAPQRQLSAGEGLKVMNHGEMSAPTHINITQINAWQQRRLVFRDDTLSAIVAEFNRYNRDQMRIDDKALGEMRYSGVWDADRPEVLLNYLNLHSEVQIVRDDEDIVLRRR